VIVTAIVDGTVTVRCTNPGGNDPPGQQVSIHTIATGPFQSDKNGNVSGELTAVVNIPRSAACPGNMVQSLDPHFQTLRFIVEQNNAQVINQLYNLPPN